MSTSAVLRARFPGLIANYHRYVGAAGRSLDKSGQMGWFFLTAMRQIPWALRRYRRESLRLIAELGMGTGAMAVIGGTVAIMGFVMLAGGSLIAIQGFTSLGNIGVETYTGFAAAATGPISCTGRPPTSVTPVNRCRPISGPSRSPLPAI